MKDWQRIRAQRPDLTDYLIHSVGPNDRGSLFDIIQCGYLKPTFGDRPGRLGKFGPCPTVKGPRPAVCFTEQPIECFATSCRVLMMHYGRGYGVAVLREYLFDFGGRPVIYGDKTLLGTEVPPNHPQYQEGQEIYTGGKLVPELHYLWAPLSLYPFQTPIGNYPLDFGHEREWRCLGLRDLERGCGTLPEDGVPLLLPGDDPHQPAFRIVVAKEEDVGYIHDFIRCLAENREEEAQKGNTYKVRYLDALSKVRVISVETVSENWKRVIGAMPSLRPFQRTRRSSRGEACLAPTTG